jgi:hypothetical protein
MRPASFGRSLRKFFASVYAPRAARTVLGNTVVVVVPDGRS